MAEKTADKKELTFSKKINIVKLLLSSLFARKQNYLIYNGRKPGTVFYSSVHPEQAMFYKPDIDDQMARVVFSDKAMSVLFEVFPFFKETVGVIFLPKFLSIMNKKLAAAKGEAPAPIVNQDTNELTFRIPDNMTPEELFKNPKERAKFLRGTNECYIGNLITEDDFFRYDEIVNRFLKFNVEPVEREITIAEAYAKDKVVLVDLRLHNSVKNMDVGLRLPVQDGTNIVSFKEYLSKKKVPWKYRMSVQFDEANNVAKVSYGYRDDMVDAISITPGALWFPFRVK